MAEFEELVRSIDEIDPGSYSFRYPVNRSGEAPLPEHFVIGILGFAPGMDSLLDLLDGATRALHEEFQVEAEARYELEEFLGAGGDA